MKKKFLILTLVCVLTLSLAACLTACSHKHTLTKVDAVDATCTATGNSEYYKCTDADCGKFFSDAEGTEEIEKDSWVIAAKGHSYGEWTTEKDATYTEEGVMKRICSVCGNEETKTIPVKTPSTTLPAENTTPAATTAETTAPATTAETTAPAATAETTVPAATDNTTAPSPAVPGSSSGTPANPDSGMPVAVPTVMIVALTAVVLAVSGKRRK